MGSMKGKQAKIDAAFGRLADMIPSGNLLASVDPVGFVDTVTAELKDLRAENVKLKGTLSIKQDRINDLEKALRDTLRQLENPELTVPRLGADTVGRVVLPPDSDNQSERK